MTCEYCWERSSGATGEVRGISEYSTAIRRAEAEGWPCCERDAAGNLTENARRLRAGQFWDPDTKTDTRITKSAVEGPTGDTTSPHGGA